MKLMVAGGGTGGHLFPGLAVAEEFQNRPGGAAVMFVGTGRPIEKEVFEARGLASRTIRAAGIKGRGPWGTTQSLSLLPWALIQAVGLIREFDPDLILGVGGYVSGPVGLAARLMGRPTAIQEQNSIPGLTNRLLGHLVDLIFISFESAARFFPPSKTYLTGNPIRREIIAASKSQRKASDRFVLLVLGGSQGAHLINEVVVEAVRVLMATDLPLEMIHQTGTADFEQVKSAYEVLGVPADVRPFFQDMSEIYLAADLVVSRAGALTVAELSVIGRPAIFIPLPTAADNHQEYNARSLVDQGAAGLILQKDLTPDRLAAEVANLAADRPRLTRMSAAAIEAARPDAASRICEICLRHLEGRPLGSAMG